MDGHGSTKLRAAAPGTRVPDPDDALVEMLELLPAKSLHRFKCVSKSWCRLVTDPLHRHRHGTTRSTPKKFRLDELDAVRGVQTYSSAAGTWSDRAGAWRDWGSGRTMAPIQPGTGAAVAHGLLHLAVGTDGTCTSGPNNNLVAVDEEGHTRRIIPLPRREVAEKDWHSVFVARSQGRIHYLMCVRPPHGWLSEEHPLKLLVWVLEDYDAGEWVLKHTAGFTELFGRVACQFRVEHSVVAEQVLYIRSSSFHGGAASRRRRA